MAWVYTSPRHWRVERWIYRVVGVDADAGQAWRSYLRGLLAFSAAGVLLLYALQRIQPLLPCRWVTGRYRPICRSTRRRPSSPTPTGSPTCRSRRWET
ncbi:potassium-transporting ATPase subunit KdpA [Tessaracoccus coleopterorum]|uniref:potassium-transporting ATPase subunit KdpA n=1 Tax=Tessaracoccus coleopterorum TaxID=2714950 RepID=UPI0022B2318C|nr:potassium-transporting ATPase subunit KdpA [Tessaracoccus coleopterorum]